MVRPHRLRDRLKSWYLDGPERSLTMKDQQELADRTGVVMLMVVMEEMVDGVDAEHGTQENDRHERTQPSS